MRDVREQIIGYARSDVPVLVLGESGTGKDVVARCLHLSSRRALGPYEIRNVAAVPETLVDSELFGSEEGAYTGARKREGCFEAAHGGTLFLDEIGDAGAALQASLLRVVEDGVIRRLGGNRSKRVDCRLIFATNRNLELKHHEKPFRSDLFYRISTLSLELPALRDRREDIPELANSFLQAHSGVEKSLSPKILDLMVSAPWPGNVRQLKSSIERALVLAADAPLGPEHFRF
jgi:transcriptional regulator with PAS, ATPase and Fis domain